MRVLVIVKATRNSEAGVMAGEELQTAMGQFNQELARAGILLAGDGLQPSSKGKRVRFSVGLVLVMVGAGAVRSVISGSGLIASL